MHFETDVFIEEIRKRPCLWNSNSPDHGDKLLKLKCWNELVDIYARRGASSEDRRKLCVKLQQKWRNIRDNFVKQLKKNARQNESGPGVKFTTPYGYFNNLLFLKDSVISNPRNSLKFGPDATKSEQDDESGDKSDTSDSNEILWTRKKIKKKRKVVGSGSQLVATTNDNEDGDEPGTSKKKKKNENEDVGSQLMGVLTKTLDIKKSEEDEDRLFFLSLVKDFKKIPEDKQLRTKLELIKVINDARESKSTYSDPIQAEPSENSERPVYVAIKIEGAEDRDDTEIVAEEVNSFR
uniref:MADF domain-containing protein n=1 Tax=Pectinophora gossypiella TaxID=13191 RepID=A0A1E1WBJ4_PECGO